MGARVARAVALVTVLVTPAALAAPPSGGTVTMPARRDPYRAPILRSSIGAATSFEAAARGDRLVVVVMKGTWCRVCIDQLSRLAALRQGLTALGAQVVGLTVDPPEKNHEIRRRYALPFDILSDPKHLLVEDLGLWSPAWGHPLPSLLLFDRCGVERLRIEGREPADRPEPALLALLRQLTASPERCDAANVTVGHPQS